uniref:FXYD domain-containing ion transport regulator n=1 Tax=Cyprinus carpio TaxID=7962 RepID=A0A8C1VNE0_CYPCA
MLLFLDYEALRIGGLVFTALLVAGGVGVLCCKYANQKESRS